MRLASHVYLALYSPGEGLLFVKVGKADSPERRGKAIATSLPGGLTMMLAAGVWCPEAAYRREAELLEFANEHPGLNPVSGEWFAATHEGVMALTERIKAIDPDAFMVEACRPKPQRGVWAGRRNKEATQRQAAN